MKEQIPISDDMPDKLKSAINYLNENNISLTDKIDVEANFDKEEDDEDLAFNGVISDDDIEDTEFDEDDIYEEDVDLSDLESMF